MTEPMARNSSKDTPPNSTDIAQRLEEQKAEEAQATAHLAALQESRAGMLLTATDSELQVHDDEIAAAKRRLNRAQAWIARLTAALGVARADEEDAPKRKAYGAAKKKVAAVQERLETEYSALAADLASLLSDLQSCEREIASVNRDLPGGAERLVSPEVALRHRPAQPRELVNEQVVELWVYSVTGHILDPATAARVRPTDGNGGYLPAEGRGHPQKVERRTFRELTYQPAVSAVEPKPLTQAVALPGLRPDEPSVWPVQPALHAVHGPIEVVHEPVMQTADGEPSVIMAA
jgi:hypothetical protein